MAFKSRQWLWKVAGLSVMGLLFVMQGAILTSVAGADSSEEIIRRVETLAYELDEGGVRIPGYGMSSEPGAPRLPVSTFAVEIPGQTGWQVSYQSLGGRDLQERATITAVPVAEWDSPVDLVAGFPEYVPEVDRPDPAIYQVDRFYPPEPVVWGEPQRQRGQWLLPVQVYPFQYNPVTGELRYHPDVTVRIDVSGVARGEEKRGWVKEPTGLLGEGDWLRIRTGERGMYRLTHGELLAAGVPVETVDPGTFRMLYEGQEIDIEVIGENDGSFDDGDLVVFFAEPYEQRWQNHNVYQFGWGVGAGARMGSRGGDSGMPVVTTVTRTMHVENDLEYCTWCPRPVEADHWFDDWLMASSSNPTVTWSFPLGLGHPLITGNVEVRAVIHSVLASGVNPDHYAGLYLNGNQVGEYWWDKDSASEYWISETVSASWLNGASDQLVIVADRNQLGLDYYLMPDWVELAYGAEAIVDAGSEKSYYVEQGAAGAAGLEVRGFSTDAIAVYEIANGWHPVKMETVESELDGGEYTVRFWDDEMAAGSYTMSALEEDVLLAPLAVEVDEPTSWSTPGHSTDYIAIIGSSRTRIALGNSIGEQLSAAVQPLLAHRAAEGYRVVEIDVQDIYDEWSYGRAHPQAIRDFLTYAYWNWNEGEDPVGYVMLVGDSTYDLRDVLASPLQTLIPPYLAHVDPFVGEVPADSRYVSVDGPDDYLPDIAIARLPANDGVEAANAVAKILAYEDPAQAAPGDWQQRVWFTAGKCNDSGGNLQEPSNEIRADWLPADYLDLQIYYGDPVLCPDSDVNTQGDFNVAVQGAFNQGALYLQWMGHGNPVHWGGGPDFRYDHIDGMQANTRWPVTGHYACNTGWFVYMDYGRQTLGESFVVRYGDRGSVSDLAGAGLHTRSSMWTYDQGVVKSMFQDRIERVGDMVNASKLHYFGATPAYHDVIDTMTLFGDPATKIRYPGTALSVELDYFIATAYTDHILLEWETVSEIDTAAFRLYRATVNDPGLPTLISPVIPAHPGSVLGYYYDYPDTFDLVPGTAYWYWIEDMNLSGIWTLNTEPELVPSATFLGVDCSRYDFDCNGHIDTGDITAAADRWDCATGDTCYASTYDLDNNGRVAVKDIMTDAGFWGCNFNQACYLLP